jgi:exopolyphosphatase / guanosine-5'-triphosphate,3'-diphosphate pyrophosphatase
MTAVIASIDIGSHTARLLVARTGEQSSSFTPLARKRAYTCLAGDFVRSGRRIIPRPAVERLACVLDEFLSQTRRHCAADVYAAATGVLRDAENRDQVLAELKRMSGIQVRCLSGTEEAILTSTGVIHALGLSDESHVIFDLGGGSTEFVINEGGVRSISSLTLGASVATARWFISDPPSDGELAGLESEIAEVLADSAIHIRGSGEGLAVVGTGGTVTALAAALEGIKEAEVVPGRINGILLDLIRLEELLDLWKTKGLEERMVFSGFDKGRAEVIVGGAMIVRGILRHFGVGRVTACMSDLLEGLIIEAGERYE